MNNLEIKFLALNENIALARQVAASFVSYLNPMMDEIMDIKTIVSEGVSNAIIHGYKMNGTKYVYLRLNIKKNRLEIIIQDYGIGIENVKEVLEKSYSSKKDEERAGMGFTIMQTLSDKFNVQSYPKLGTKLIIEKELTPTYEEVV